MRATSRGSSSRSAVGLSGLRGEPGDVLSPACESRRWLSATNTAESPKGSESLRGLLNERTDARELRREDTESWEEMLRKDASKTSDKERVLGARRKERLTKESSAPTP